MVCACVCVLFLSSWRCLEERAFRQREQHAQEGLLKILKEGQCDFGGRGSGKMKLGSAGESLMKDLAG